MLVFGNTIMLIEIELSNASDRMYDGRVNRPETMIMVNDNKKNGSV